MRIPMDKIGKYVIQKELGRGAMGIVYKAEDPIIGRTVAIKTIRMDYLDNKVGQGSALKRFIREAQSAGNLSHPNIITIHDINEDQDVMYIVMEYIAGTSLEDQIHSKKVFSVDEVVRLMTPVAQALDYAHSKGVIHRDIKPGNIIVDESGKPIIVDFGIARVSASTMTQADTALGTPYYMAPEQIAGKKIDGRVDVFSLGALIYEMLTDQKAFSGENITTVIYKIINEAPVSVHSLREFLSPKLDPILVKAMAKDPDSRYSTCCEIVDALRFFAVDNQIPVSDTRVRSENKTRMKKTSPVKPMAEKFPMHDGRRDHAGVGNGVRNFFAGLIANIKSADNKKALLGISGAMLAVLVVVLSLVIFSSREKKTFSGGSSGGPLSSEETQILQDPGGSISDQNTEQTSAETKQQEAIRKQEINPTQIKLPRPSSLNTRIRTAEKDLAAKKYFSSLKLAEVILNTHPDNERIRKIYYKSLEGISRGQVRSVWNAYKNALASRSVEVFYQKSCSPEVFQKMKKHMSALYRKYNIDRNEFTEPELKFLYTPQGDYSNVRMRFFQKSFARTRSGNKTEFPINGFYTWVITKKRNRWIIEDITYAPN